MGAERICNPLTIAVRAETVVEVDFPHTDLQEVLELARIGAVKAQIETFPLDQINEVLDRLELGKIMGRAVITPSA